MPLPHCQLLSCIFRQLFHQEVYPISAQKNHRPRSPYKSPKTVILSARSGARTLDTLIKSQVLYQLS